MYEEENDYIPSRKFRYDVVKITFNIPVKLKQKIFNYSQEIGLPMTQTIILLLNQALESKNVVSDLSKCIQMLEEAREKQYYDKANDSLI